MASKILTAATANQVLDANQEIRLRSVIVTAAAADSTVTIKDAAGVVLLVVAAKAGASFQYRDSKNETILPPGSKADTVGAAAFTRLEY